MSFLSGLGKTLATIGGGLVGYAIADKICSSKNHSDNMKFMNQLQCNPAMRLYVAERCGGCLGAVYGMNDSQIANLRHGWDHSFLKREWKEMCG
jgi:hypothetical protein